MKSWKVIPLLAFAGVIWIQAASASAHGMSPCQDDVKRLCGDAQYSRSGIAACLDEHASELSPACAEHVAKEKAHREQFDQACSADTEKLCAGADRGWQTYRCLRDHSADLSPACKDQLAGADKAHHHRPHHEAEPLPGEASGS